MRHTAYFVIEPRSEALRSFPEVLSQEFTEVLSERVLVSREYADRSSWRQAELQQAVKLLFVARVREYEPLSSDAIAEQVLGSAAVSVEVFDRWWSIRLLSFEGRTEEMHEYLVAVAGKVEPTGNEIVDAWVKGLANAGA